MKAENCLRLIYFCVKLYFFYPHHINVTNNDQLEIITPTTGVKTTSIVHSSCLNDFRFVTTYTIAPINNTILNAVHAVT